MRFIQVEKDGPITTITLNRPEVMNVLNGETHHELEDAFNGFADDPEQQICIVTGAGDRAFCAGSDLKSIHEGGLHAYPVHGYAGLIERFDCDKPIIAAVNGLALGGGFEVALACDIIVASEQAKFGLPEPLVGAFALGGGVHRLAREIGPKQAMGMILTGRPVDAAEGRRLGFVNEIVPHGEVLAAARRWAEAMLKCAPLSLRVSKQTLYRGLGEASLAEAMKRQESYPAYRDWMGSEDMSEGFRAFAEKRPPRWQGR